MGEIKKIIIQMDVDDSAHNKSVNDLIFITSVLGINFLIFLR